MKINTSIYFTPELAEKHKGRKHCTCGFSATVGVHSLILHFKGKEKCLSYSWRPMQITKSVGRHEKKIHMFILLFILKNAYCYYSSSARGLIYKLSSDFQIELLRPYKHTKKNSICKSFQTAPHYVIRKVTNV